MSHLSIDDGNTKNISTTPTAAEKENNQENCYMLPLLTLLALNCRRIQIADNNLGTPPLPQCINQNIQQAIYYDFIIAITIPPKPDMRILKNVEFNSVNFCTKQNVTIGVFVYAKILMIFFKSYQDYLFFTWSLP